MADQDFVTAGRHHAATIGTELTTGDETLPADLCVRIHRIMVRSRKMEERMIKMAKSGEGYFWIGGPGEEAFNTCLGLQIRKGRGPEYDFLHLHYRNEATLVAMGMPLIDGLRQMAMRRTDPHSMGRNFPGHFCAPQWNVVPVSSVIENQFVVAPGTAIVQKRIPGGEGITIVVGGDAGTAEGDFASCMIWSSRPVNPLPVLMIVMNNGWGISTCYSSQHAEKHIADRARPFGIPAEVVDGNDPVASWHSIRRAMAHCRSRRSPYLIEAMVSRLHGHSSSSGAARINEPDCIEMFEARLIRAGILDRDDIQRVHEEAAAEVDEAVEQVINEPLPTPEDVERYTYYPSPVDAVYPGDYTGLPQA